MESLKALLQKIEQPLIFASKENYKKASGIKPNEQYPKTRIAEIDKLLAEQKSDADAKAKEEAYKASIEFHNIYPTNGKEIQNLS